MVVDFSGRRRGILRCEQGLKMQMKPEENAQGFDIARAILSDTPLPPGDTADGAWCGKRGNEPACSDMFQAAQRYNGDMQPSLGYCNWQSVTGSADPAFNFYSPGFADVVLNAQLQMAAMGRPIIADGKLGPNTLAALKQTQWTTFDDSIAGWPAYLGSALRINGMPGQELAPECGRRLAEDEPEQPATPPAKKQDNGTMILIISAGLVAAYYLYTKFRQ